MEINSSRSDLVRNISIIEFLFIIVLIVLANFTLQVEETDKKERRVLELLEQNNELLKEIKQLRRENRELKNELEYLKKTIPNREKLEILAKENFRLKEEIKELEGFKEELVKLKGIDKPNCDIAKNNSIKRILKITFKADNVYDIEKRWKDSLNDEFSKVTGLNELIRKNIPINDVKKFGNQVYQWTETQNCRFRVLKDETQVSDLPTKYSNKLERVIDRFFYQ